jgi:uncharacterized SAM-binding protein YcdF (DUF218 family)
MTTRRIICLVIGGIFFLNGALLLMFTNANVGYFAIILLGLMLIAGGIFYRRIPAWIKTVCITGMVLWFGFSFFLYGYGWTDTVDYQEDAVVVLGAGIRGEKLGRVLKDRLDCALEYHRKNPNAVIVVTGGQGPQEDIPEGLAMERYLLQNGVPQDRIIKEDRSTSTYENFANAKDLLDEHFSAEYTVAFISNDFHIFRAGSLARQVGYNDVSHLHNTTLWYTVLPAGLRECLAVVKFWIFKV